MAFLWYCTDVESGKARLLHCNYMEIRNIAITPLETRVRVLTGQVAHYTYGD